MSQELKVKNIDKNKPLGMCYALRSEGGYSFMELIVAIGLFAVVVTLMTGTFFISLRGQGKTTTAQNVSDNARYAMEVISKEIRMGKGYSIVLNPSQIKFTSSMPNRNNAQVSFFLDTDITSGTYHQIMFDDDTNINLPFEDSITSNNVEVTNLEFIVSDPVPPPDSQPRITIIMQVKSKGTNPDIASSIDLQTTISSRSL